MTKAIQIDADSPPEPTIVIESAEGGGPVDPAAWAKFGELVEATSSNGAHPDFDRLADTFPTDIL